jgi:hypothetical protein
VLTGLLRRYPVPLGYLAGLVGMAMVWTFFLSPTAQEQLDAWASTNLANLPHRPLSTLAVSAFVTEDGVLPWLLLTSVGLVLCVQRFGNLRTAILVISGHVAGTLVSEGVLALRIHQGLLPDADREISDVGPSYITAAALVGAIVAGPVLWKRGLALAVWLLAILTWFDGITTLDVAAVGHTVAMSTGAGIAGLYLLWNRRRAPAAMPGPAVRSNDHAVPETST